MKASATVAYVLALLLPPAFSAPAPVYRHVPDEPLSKRIVGTWKLTWGGSEGTVVIRENGLWWETLGEQHYAGTYAIEGDKLTVKECNIISESQWANTYVFTIAKPVRNCKTITGSGVYGIRIVLEKESKK